jgi:hypothetical protein
MRLFTLIWLYLLPLALCASTDTVRLDDGVMRTTNQARSNWEESIILNPGGPCRILEAHIYYGAGSGADVVYLAGDAAEGAIPPTQYCLPYNTIAAETIAVSSPGWRVIDFRRHNIVRGGFDRIVVQHLVRPDGPYWAMDAGQSDLRSFYFDPVSPNPNFFNIPGIFYRANGDYMVRLVVEPLAVQRPLPGFVDWTSPSGLVHNGTPIKTDNVTTVDFNNDGLDDVVLGSRIFINKGALRFEALASPISGSATVWADIDNDGDMDCFAVNGFGNDKVWRNNGDLTFTDITQATGITNNAPTVTPLWLDYNRDGRLDLFIANGRTEQSGQEVYFQDKLFRQRADGTFEDVTEASGIAAAEPAPHFDTWGASLCDYNDDGLVDIFVATYRLAPDRLYRNNGDGTFTDVSVSSGVQGMPTDVPNYFGHGMGSDWADLDNDGDVDLAVGNLGHPDSRARYSNPSLLWINDGTTESRFSARTASNGGVNFFEMNAGMCFGDFDHDGLQDLWHGQIAYEQRGAGALRRARIYKNVSGAMADRTWHWNVDHHGPWTAARADLDGDGDLDLVCASGTEFSKLYRNDVSTEGAGIIFRLEDTTAIRHAYGARLTAWAGQVRHRRWLPGTVSGGRASQMTRDLHVGLGAASGVDSVHVRWPDGTTTAWRTPLSGGASWLLRRGASAQRLASHLPSPLTPLHGAVGVPSRTTFTWRTSGAATLLETSTTIDFSDNITRYGPFSEQTAIIELEPTGRSMYWRLCDVSDTTRWTAPRLAVIGAPAFDAWQVTYPRDGDTGVAMHFDATWDAARPYETSLPFPVAYEVMLVVASDTTNIVYTSPAVRDLRDSIVQLAASTTYLLRIRPYLDGIAARGDWTTIRFTTYGPPPAPLLATPAQGATGISVRPTLAVHRLSTAEQYVFQIDSLGVFEAPYERVRYDSMLTVLPALKPQTTYRWRAQATNRAGLGEWSTVGEFTTGGTVGVPLNELVLPPSVRTIVTDMLGREVASALTVDIRNSLALLPPGVYGVQHIWASGRRETSVVLIP